MILPTPPRASVAVIGVGGVGARHLQSLARLSLPASVYAVDPSPEALERAGALFKEWLPPAGSSRPSLTLLADPSGLPPELDVVVVATRAHHRLQAVQALLQATRPHRLVLEKFLFARRAEFAVGAAAVAASGAAGPVVNCPRRIYPGYCAIARQLAGARQVDLRISASVRTAPLGTIGIHFIDLLDFLCGSSGRLRCSPVEQGALVEGNRQLRDFAGRLQATLEGAAAGRLTVDATADSRQPLWVTIDSDRGRFFVSERDQSYHLCLPEDDWAWRQERFEVPLQSQLTAGIIEALVRGEDCGLTPFARSIDLHLPLFDALMECYRAGQGDLTLEEIPFT
jgi:predicted dehydrogenase